MFVVLLLLGTPHVAAADQTDFSACLKRLESEAIASGIPADTTRRVLTGLRPIERVLQSDRSQPEFVKTFTEYFTARVNERRVEEGRRLLKEHGALLEKIKDRSGVPPQYLVALWGLETNFGSYFGKLDIPAALATLACDSRRAAFFQAELFAVLNVIATGDMQREQLVGSWAGAIGHMQFMPTTFLEYAVDGDGDGKRNLMSQADALTSGANYLQSLGWASGFRWGREVLLPKNFDYSTTGSDQWRPLADWQQLGVLDAFGNPLADAPIEAAVLLPAGHEGPAFLVYDNYKIVLDWNRSHFYALSVGRLADRIAGAAPLQRPPPAADTIRLKRERILWLQEHLNSMGYGAGKPDGILGSGTSAAVRKAQLQFGLRADGYPNKALYAQLVKAESQE
ncbi:MAG: lytic murein transglycosylase [Pseudomonadales bacterium]